MTGIGWFGRADETSVAIADACELVNVLPVDKIFCCFACNCANSANSCGVFEFFLSISNILP